MLIDEVSTGFRLLSIAAIDLSSNHDEDEADAASETEPLDAEPGSDDSSQSEDSCDAAEGVQS